MGIHITAEVFSHAPRDIKGNTFLVLLCLADSASDDFRTVYVDVEFVAKYTRCSPKTLQAALARLTERGIIRDALESKKPPFSHLNGHLVKYITPVSEWKPLGEKSGN